MPVQVSERRSEVCNDRRPAETRPAAPPARLAVPLRNLRQDLAPRVRTAAAHAEAHERSAVLVLELRQDVLGQRAAADSHARARRRQAALLPVLREEIRPQRKPLRAPASFPQPRPVRL